MIFSLYFQIILSFSLSFLFHLFNFKKHFHSFFTTTTNNNNHKCLNPNSTYPVSSKSKLLISLPPHSMIHDNMEPSMVCTEGIGFESMQLVDDYDYSIIDENNEGDEYYWKTTRVVEEEEEEEGVNGNNKFPPPLSTLGSNGLPSYILLPVRMNGRLQLNKKKVKRPKTVYADREDGRLRLFLVTDECYIEDDEVEQEEEEMVEESRYEYEEDDRVREWNNNEKYRKRYHCHHQLVDNIHGSHGNLLMYGVGIV